jgi:hypothetical protein
MRPAEAYVLGWISATILMLLICYPFTRLWGMVRDRLRARAPGQVKPPAAVDQGTRPAAITATTATSAAAAPTDGWFPLLDGKRLEYKASGFSIELRPDAFQGPYVLLSPEGTPLAAGNLLATLKNVGAFAAAERAQFEPSRQGGAT